MRNGGWDTSVSPTYSFATNGHGVTENNVMFNLSQKFALKVGSTEVKQAGFAAILAVREICLCVQFELCFGSVLFAWLSFRLALDYSPLLPSFSLSNDPIRCR